MGYLSLRTEFPICYFTFLIDLRISMSISFILSWKLLELPCSDPGTFFMEGEWNKFFYFSWTGFTLILVKASLFCSSFFPSQISLVEWGYFFPLIEFELLLDELFTAKLWSWKSSEKDDVCCSFTLGTLRNWIPQFSSGWWE